MTTDVAQAMIQASSEARNQAERIAKGPLLDVGSLQHLGNISDLAIVYMDLNGLKPGAIDGWT
mgnify:CR=1 FL=1